MNEIIAQRVFSPLYILLDCIFLVFLAALLIWKKEYGAVIVGLIFGAVYMVVDYGIFNLLLHTRTISEGYSMFWVLLWMSVSYGFTNFAWIWLWIRADKDLFSWSFLILLWWFCAPLITNTLAGDGPQIVIQRTTGAYHGYMAIILFVGYALAVIWNLKNERKNQIPILWILIIGILVQFGWEAGLLIGGIRSAEVTSIAARLQTLLVNSLLETNLGMPYIYAIYIAFAAKRRKDLKKRFRVLSFKEMIRENRGKIAELTGWANYR